MKPTPTTIQEAIKNGLEDVIPGKDRVEILRLHVKDFIAQKFGILEPALAPIWNKLFPEDKK